MRSDRQAYARDVVIGFLFLAMLCALAVLAEGGAP